MKRVLHISKYYYPFRGGTEQIAQDCVNSLKDLYEQKVICFNDCNVDTRDMIDGVEVIRCGVFTTIASQGLSTSFGKKLKNVIGNFKPDIIIFHYPNPFVAYSLCKYLKKKTFKFILYWHLDITKQKILGKLFKGQNLKLLKYADKIIATSPNYVEGSPWLLPNKNKCVVIPCCVNEERLKYDESHISKANEIKEKYKGKTICFAFGRHVQYKGLTYLVQASKLLDDSFVVLIGGKGPLTDSLVEEAKDDKKVEFLGRISDDDLKSYLLACDIFCFPSITKNEAFGIGLAEAMYYGKPAVTFNIPCSGVNYVSINGETGIEVENGNVEKYAEAIKKLANDDSLKTLFGNNGKDRVNELFMEDKFKNEIKTLIVNL